VTKEPYCPRCQGAVNFDIKECCYNCQGQHADNRLDQADFERKRMKEEEFND